MILELKDIKMSYTNARKEVFNLLNGVGFSVEKGSVTALIGGNGTGKTTLFNIISGFEKRYSGQVLFDDNDISRMSAHKISDAGIGRLFQGRQLMDDLTLMENMKIASYDMKGEKPFDFLFKARQVRRSETKKEQRAIDVLKEVFGEENKYLQMLDTKVSSFSYGEQRLIAMARLLMGNASFLLLDEPTSGVNPHYIEIIKGIIRDAVEREGKTVLLIEHNMPFVRSVADTCLYLSDGKIRKNGPTPDVLDDEEVRKDYLGL